MHQKSKEKKAVFTKRYQKAIQSRLIRYAKNAPLSFTRLRGEREKKHEIVPLRNEMHVQNSPRTEIPDARNDRLKITRREKFKGRGKTRRRF